MGMCVMRMFKLTCDHLIDTYFEREILSGTPETPSGSLRSLNLTCMIASSLTGRLSGQSGASWETASNREQDEGGGEQKMTRAAKRGTDREAAWAGKRAAVIRES